MTIDQEREIDLALIFLGFEVHPEECDICEDGSVYYGLTQILPPGSIYEENTEDDD